MSMMNKMKLRNGETKDKNIITCLYNDARNWGKINGTCDWSNNYPNEEILEEDILAKRLFVLENSDGIIGVVSILLEDDLDYENVGWKDLKHCIPARLCVSKNHQNKGIGKLIMYEIITYARENGFGSLRLLASINNTPANKLYSRLGFINKGQVNLYDNVFYAYEYIIE